MSKRKKVDVTKPGVRGFKPEVIAAAAKAWVENSPFLMALHAAVDAAPPKIKPWRAGKKRKGAE